MFTPWEVQNLIVNQPDVAAQLRNASPAEADGILEKAMGHRHVTINILGAQPEGEESEEHEGKGKRKLKEGKEEEGERLAKEQPPVAPPRDLPTLDLDAPASPDATPPPVQPGPAPGAPSPQIPLFTPPNARGAQNNPPAGLSKAEDLEKARAKKQTPADYFRNVHGQNTPFAGTPGSGTVVGGHPAIAGIVNGEKQPVSATKEAGKNPSSAAESARMLSEGKISPNKIPDEHMSAILDHAHRLGFSHGLSSMSRAEYGRVAEGLSKEGLETKERTVAESARLLGRGEIAPNKVSVAHLNEIEHYAGELGLRGKLSSMSRASYEQVADHLDKLEQQKAKAAKKMRKAESELAGSFEPLCKAAKVEPLPQPKPFPLPGKTTAGNAATQPGKSEDAQEQAPDQPEEQPDPTLYQAYMGGGGPVVVDRSTDRRMAEKLEAEKAAKRR